MCSPMCAVVKTLCLKLCNLGWCLNHNFIFPLSTLLGKTWHFQFSPLFSRRTVEVVLRHSRVWTSWFWWCCVHRMTYTKYCELLLWLFCWSFLQTYLHPALRMVANYYGFRLAMLVSLTNTSGFVAKYYEHKQAAAKAWAMKFQWRVSVW